MKRRMMAAVLSLMMLLGLMVPAASAQGTQGPTLTVTASETEAHPGDVITYTVTLGPVSELLSLQLELDLPQGLTYVAGSGRLADGVRDQMNLDGYPVTWTEQSQMINGFGLYNTYTASEDTVLATFQCRVDQASAGALSVGLANLDFVCGTITDYEDVTDLVQVVPARLAVTIPVAGIQLDQDTLTVQQGETGTLKATVQPDNASDQGVTFVSSNPAVATVDQDGTVHGVGEGETTITATTRDGGFTATCRVTVPHVHSFGSDWSHDGQNHWHECTAGDGETADLAPHTGGTATCEQRAVCEVCGASYGDYATHTLTHVDRVEATHYAAGHVEYWECSLCHKLFSDAQGTREMGREDTLIPQIAHDYADDWTSDDTSHWHQCSCGDQADVAEHSFSWVVDREPTEDQTGLKHEACTVCGYSRNEGTPIDQLDHDLTFHPAVEATCVREGSLAYYSCANCGRNFADADATRVLTDVVTPVDPDHHTGETQRRDAAEATCTQQGYTGDLYCADCGQLLQSGAPIPATGHSLEQVDRVEPTHTAAGHIAYWQCTTCGALFADQEGQQPLKAEELVLEQIPHSFGEDWVSDGTGHWHACPCGAKSDVEAHSFGDWTVTRQPTQTDTGSRERVCTVCGYVETQTLAALAPVENGGSGNGGQGQTSEQPGGDQSTGGQTSTDGTDSQSKTAAPKTGDESLIVLGLGALALAGTGLMLLTVTGKKRREDR